MMEENRSDFGTDIYPSEYEIYPNPVSAFFEVTSEHDELTKVKIYDSYGKAMHESIIRNRALINCSTWQKGNYTVQLDSDSNHEVKNLTISF